MGRWESCLIMVCMDQIEVWVWLTMIGVDACNTTLEVLLFAAAMNLGQTWLTVLTMFGCMFSPLMLKE